MANINIRLNKIILKLNHLIIEFNIILIIEVSINLNTHYILLTYNIALIYVNNFMFNITVNNT